MKVGLEVEGAYQGVGTLFCSAEEYLNRQGCFKGLFCLQPSFPVFENITIRHLYISDHEGLISTRHIEEFEDLPIEVTLEVTSTYAGPRPLNVSLMLHIACSEADWWTTFRDRDQVKLVSPNNMVQCAQAAHFVTTHPDQFKQDIVVDFDPERPTQLRRV